MSLYMCGINSMLSLMKRISFRIIRVTTIVYLSFEITILIYIKLETTITFTINTNFNMFWTQLFSSANGDIGTNTSQQQ